ncbi:hypothetical protein CEXT_607251, partial [Caerostris extrusa]
MGFSSSLFLSLALFLPLETILRSNWFSFRKFSIGSADEASLSDFETSIIGLGLVRKTIILCAKKSKPGISILEKPRIH